MPPDVIQKIDRLYVCQECKANFLFLSDVEDHKQMTKHVAFYELPI